MFGEHFKISKAYMCRVRVTVNQRCANNNHDSAKAYLYRKNVQIDVQKYNLTTQNTLAHLFFLETVSSTLYMRVHYTHKATNYQR